MKRFVPYEKMSRKARKAIDAKKRGNWGGCSPVLRSEPDPKAYRRHAKHRKQEDQYYV